MKKDIHPKMKEVTLVLRNGQKIKIKTAKLDTPGTMYTDVDPSNHPAWVGGDKVNERDANYKKFKDKYGDFDKFE